MSDTKKARLSEKTAELLYEKIVDGREYAPGSKLPNENEMSAAMNVSRTTLREAVSYLVAEGILEIHRGKGTFVADNLPESMMDMTAIRSCHSSIRAKDLFEMRLIFEPATVALACERASDEELKLLRQKAERVEELARCGGDWPAADQEFHLELIRASHNEYMRRLYPIINGAVSEILQISRNRKHMQEIAVADNRLVVDFLMKRDASGARSAMSIHMKHLINSLSE